MHKKSVNFVDEIVISLKERKTMKIIFESEEEKEKLKTAFKNDCPNKVGLKDDCAWGEGDCFDCWCRAFVESGTIEQN